RTIIVALLMTAGPLALFLHEYYEEIRDGLTVVDALHEAQTLAVTNVVLFQVFYLFNCRSLRNSVWHIGLWSNPAIYIGIAVLLLFQLCYVYLPLMMTLFDSAPLSLAAWCKAAAVALTVLPAISIEKWLRQRRAARKRQQGTSS